MCEVKEYRGIKYKIVQDDSPANPREENDSSCTLVCWHRRYTLGDEQPKCDPEEYTVRKGCFDVTIPEHPSYKTLNLYLLDHSGLSINTGGFSCPWDSGCVGFVHITKDKLREVYNIPKSASWKTLIKNPWYSETKTPREILEEGYPNDKKITVEGLAYRYMTSEVKEYNNYLSGDCYMYSIDNENFDDSWISGYTYSEIEEEVKKVIDSYLNRKEANG